MRNERRIYVDLDDVLAETARMFVELLTELHGKRVEFEEIENFDLSRSFDLTRDQLDEFMRVAHEPERLERVEPIAGAAAALSAWTERGYQVSVMTGRPPSTEAISRRWLRLRGIPHDSVQSVDKYGRSGLYEAEDPHSVIALSDLPADGFRLAVEDHLEIAARLAERLTAPVVLLDRPWNRYAERPGVTRCADWEEILERYPAP